MPFRFASTVSLQGMSLAQLKTAPFVGIRHYDTGKEHGLWIM